MKSRNETLSHQAVEAALARVLSNPEVGANKRRTRLLRYLVTETLEGRADRLKGTTIAIDVFERDADFDPRVDGVVRSEARRLRQALASYYMGVGADDPVVITIPKGGYVPRFDRRAERPAAHSVTPVGERRAEPALAPAAPSGEPAAVSPGRSDFWRSAGRLARSRNAWIALVLVIGVVVSAWSLGRDAPASRAPVAPDVVVAPFTAVGTADDLQTLASGITAQFIADLMRFPNFRLYSFEDSLRLPDDATDREIGTETGADYLVRGIVRGDDDTISVIVRLVDATDGSVLWSEAFVRPLEPTEIASLQAEISGEVAAKIGEPYGVVRRSVSTAMADDAAGMSGFACVMSAHAYRHANRYDLYAPARACLDVLVEQAPDYAEAWALLAFLRLDGGRFGYEARTAQEREAAYTSARSAAAQALSLDPDNELATSALAMIEHYAGRFGESLKYSELAVQANPNDPSTLAYHGWRLAAQGRLEDGVPFVEEAIRRSVNPQPTFFHVLALDRLMRGDMEGMLVAARRAAVDRSSPSDAFLAIAYGALGAEDEAKASLESMARKWPLMGSDPAAAFAWHNLHPDLIDAIVGGLERAGWEPPGG